MELRRSNHYHFVNTIKGSSVAKYMNVDYRGQPALKFKEIKEIYNLRDTIYPGEVPRICLRDDLESSPTKFFGVKVESPDLSLVRGIKIKSEPEASDLSCSNNGDERTDGLDDLSFGNMTLKQFKMKCKSKKRKCSTFVGFNKETMEACSCGKHELPNFRLKDDECDLEEPLICLKSKLSKTIKSKRKSSRKSVSVTSANATSLIKSEKVHCDEDLLQTKQDSLSPVKVEVSEPDHSQGPTIFGVTSASDFSYSEQVDSIVTVCKDVPDSTDAHTLQTEAPYPKEQPQSYSLNEESFQYKVNLEPKFDVGVSSWDIVEVVSPEVISYECSDWSEFRNDGYMSCPLSYDVPSESMSPTTDFNGYSLIQVPVTTIACDLERSSTVYPVEEALCSVSNAASCEYTEDIFPKFGASSSGWEIVKVDNPEIISYQCSNMQEFGQESHAVYALPYDISPQSMPPTKDCSPDLDDSFKSNSSENKMAWQTSCYDRTEVPDMDNDDSLQCLENINEGTAHCYPLKSAISSSSDDGLYWSSPVPNLARHSVTVSCHCPSAEKQSQLPASMVTDVEASDKRMAPPVHPDNKMEQQHPERLLSSRKAISPTSQERLRRAMESTELDEDQRQECRGKLYFGRRTNHRILRAQGLEQLGRDGATFKPKPFLRKAKQDKKGSPPKGILKVTHPSRSVPHVSSACNALQRCSQSAIAFTQRQMQDIESLATKLTTELKSMKDIMMGKLTLELEASAATTTNENAHEVRIAVENARKAEETARKWLSIMARDCNRFHKIMKLTEESTAASELAIQRGRKISFADEAGGKLCHIKVFKDDKGTSLQQCDTVKQRLQVE